MSYLQDTSVFGYLENGTQLGTNPGVNRGALLVVALALFLFGIGFNWLINELHRRGLNDGYVWLEVVIGVCVTLAAASFIIGLQSAFILFLLFAASGLFPALGDIYRYVRARRAESVRDYE